MLTRHSDEPPEGEPADLMMVFARTDSLLRRFHDWKYSQQGTIANPHRGQGKILRYIKKYPGSSQTELSDLLDIRQQSLGELLGKLEKGGYITREPADDRRVMRVFLTPAGLEAAPKKVDPSEIFGCLDEREQAEFRGYLLRIAEFVAKAVGDTAGEDRPCSR